MKKKILNENDQNDRVTALQVYVKQVYSGEFFQKHLIYLYIWAYKLKVLYKCKLRFIYAIQFIY